VLEGKGNVAVITNQNQFYYFSGGNLSWKKAISGKMMKEIIYSKEWGLDCNTIAYGARLD
jgi:hypothetical protein